MVLTFSKGNPMRIVRWLVMVAGVVIFLGTLAALYWVSAFGCGMATAGCRGVTIPMPWEDTELYAHLGPFFALGAGVFAVGKWGMGR